MLMFERKRDQITNLVLQHPDLRDRLNFWLPKYIVGGELEDAQVEALIVEILADTAGPSEIDHVTTAGNFLRIFIPAPPAGTTKVVVTGVMGQDPADGTGLLLTPLQVLDAAESVADLWFTPSYHGNAKVTVTIDYADVNNDFIRTVERTFNVTITEN